LLIASLIALPITAAGASLVFFASHQPTPQQKVTMQLGRSDALITPVSPPGRKRAQYIDDLGTVTSGITQGHPPGAMPAMVPTSAHVITLQASSVEVETATGVGEISVTEGAAWDRSLDGAYRSTGRTPVNEHEAMVSPHLMQRLGTHIGGTVRLAHDGPSLTITGALTPTLYPTQDELFVPSGILPLPDAGTATTWFLTGWQPTYSQFTRLVHAGYGVLGRNLMLNPPPGALPVQITSYQSLFVILGAGGAFLAALVALLAGAAMSVSARRQQRSLAVTASVGATRRDLFLVVLLQGAVLGIGGALLGTGAGIGLAASALALTDHGEPWNTWRGNYGFHVPAGILATIAAFAIVVGLISAFFPARAATRGDSLSALRGARRPMRLARSMPRWGGGLLIVGLLATAGSLIYGQYVGQARQSDHALSLPEELAFTALLATGPLALLIGVMLSGHWLLTGLARLCSRSGIALRLASRDTAASPSRVVPAAASIAVSVCIGTLALSLASASGAANARDYNWAGPLNSAAVQLNSGPHSDTVKQDAELVTAARRIVRDAGATRIGQINTPLTPNYDPTTGKLLNPQQHVFSAGLACRGQCSATFAGWSAYGTIAVVDVDELGTTVGVQLSAAERQRYRNGAAIVTLPAETRDGNVAIIRTTADSPQKPNGSKATATVVPAIVRTYTYANAVMLIAPETARRLRITTRPDTIVARFSKPPTVAQQDAMTAAAEKVFSGDGGLHVQVERGPAPTEPWLDLIAAVAGALVISASAICLGLSRVERRSDDATLAAVGGAGAVRRRVHGAQALLIVGSGSIIGAAIGISPAIAVTLYAQTLHAADIPWSLIASLSIGLPLLIAAIAWLVRLRTSNLMRRTAIS